MSRNKVQDGEKAPCKLESSDTLSVLCTSKHPWAILKVLLRTKSKSLQSKKLKSRPCLIFEFASILLETRGQERLILGVCVCFLSRFGLSFSILATIATITHALILPRFFPPAFPSLANNMHMQLLSLIFHHPAYSTDDAAISPNF